MKIKKGDRVIVLAGKDKGKIGVVKTALPDRDRVVVEGINVAKRHQKPTRAMQQGGIIDLEMPLHVSNVALVGPDDKPTRVGYRIDATGTKTRVSKRTGGDI